MYGNNPDDNSTFF